MDLHPYDFVLTALSYLTCQFSGLVQAPTYKVAVLNEFSGLKHLNEMTRSYKCFLHVSNIHTITVNEGQQ
jgi:hypothetical protein